MRARQTAPIWMSVLGKQLVALLVVLALIIAGMLFRYPQFGMLLLLGYGVASVIMRMPSAITFKMVLIILACLPVLSLRGDDDLLDYFAVYAFLLLAIGCMNVLIEEWASPRTKNEKSQG